MNKLNVTQCKGEGQSSCKRCVDKGKWNREWMCFLYHIEGYEGCYKLRRKTHTLACGMKAAFSVQNYISTT